jgi:hypothetical protein
MAKFFKYFTLRSLFLALLIATVLFCALSSYFENQVEKWNDDLFSMDHKIILDNYSESKFKTIENSKCDNFKILHNNSFALKQLNLALQNKSQKKFYCNDLKPDERLVEIEDLFINDTFMYSIKLNLHHLNLTNGSALHVCFIQRISKREGTGENLKDVDPVEIEAKKVYFNSSYKAIVNNHG